MACISCSITSPCADFPSSLPSSFLPPSPDSVLPSLGAPLIPRPRSSDTENRAEAKLLHRSHAFGHALNCAENMAALRIAPASLHSHLDSAISSSCTSMELLPTKLGRSLAPVQRRLSTAVRASSTVEGDGGNVAVGRREVLSGVAALAVAVSTGSGSALAEKPPKGFSAVLDNADGYAFLYPFGWQEVAVKGQDVAFKDVIEPLESVGVSIVRTDKTSLEELGSPDEVARALVEKVLSSPTQKTALKEASARVTNGKTYYQFEFVVQAKNFTRHALGAVAVNGGKFFTLTTGANERRWGKVEDKLRQVVDSFQTL